MHMKLLMISCGSGEMISGATGGEFAHNCGFIQVSYINNIDNKTNYIRIYLSKITPLRNYSLKIVKYKIYQFQVLQ